jgi:hypothetical protein
MGVCEGKWNECVDIFEKKTTLLQYGNMGFTEILIRQSAADH